MERVQRDCPGCSSVQSLILPSLSHEDWDTVECASCDFVYLSEAPHYQALSEDLAWTKQFEKEKKRRKEKSPIATWIAAKTRWRLRLFKEDEWAYITEKVPSGKLLDVGCGNRNRLPQGYETYGIEIEKDAAEIADKHMRKQGGRCLHAPALEGIQDFGEGFFDGIVMRSYLEHEMNPKEVLLACHHVLRKGGALYVKVPNFGTLNRAVMGVNWCGFRFPDHLNYFTIPSLKRLAQDCGFEFELRNTFTRYTNDNMHCFLIKPE